MNRDDLPAELKSFILSFLDSVGKLEVLLLLAAQPARAWTFRGVSRELRSSENSARKYLAELVDAGLLEEGKDPEPEFVYRPKSEELAEAVKQLSHHYAIYPIRIIHHIINRPVHKIQSFAEAFRIRKSEGDDDDR